MGLRPTDLVEVVPDGLDDPPHVREGDLVAGHVGHTDRKDAGAKGQSEDGMEGATALPLDEKHFEGHCSPVPQVIGRPLVLNPDDRPSKLNPHPRLKPRSLSQTSIPNLNPHHLRVLEAPECSVWTRLPSVSPSTPTLQALQPLTLTLTPNPNLTISGSSKLRNCSLWTACATFSGETRADSTCSSSHQPLGSNANVQTQIPPPWPGTIGDHFSPLAPLHS